MASPQNRSVINERKIDMELMKIIEQKTGIQRALHPFRIANSRFGDFSYDADLARQVFSALCDRLPECHAQGRMADWKKAATACAELFGSDWVAERHN